MHDKYLLTAALAELASAGAYPSSATELTIRARPDLGFPDIKFDRRRYTPPKERPGHKALRERRRAKRAMKKKSRRK